MKQVRHEVFETNSSSVHSLTMCMKDDYDRWIKGEVYLFNGYTSGYPDDKKPERKKFYTRDECINFLKSNKYVEDDFNWNDEGELENLLNYEDFYDVENYGGDFEWFEDTFVTSNGEEVVAFGYTGYDG